MNDKLEKVLTDKSIDLYFRDELPLNPRGWACVSDVGCSRSRSGVTVPRRRRDGYHFAEVLHEVAHLEEWRETDVSPHKANEVKVCKRALAIAQEYGFSKLTLEHLENELVQVEEEGDR